MAHNFVAVRPRDQKQLVVFNGRRLEDRRIDSRFRSVLELILPGEQHLLSDGISRRAVADKDGREVHVGRLHAGIRHLASRQSHIKMTQ